MIEILLFGILNGGLYALVGAGLGLTYGKQNLVDVANPAFMIVGAYLTWLASSRLGLDPYVTLPLTLPVMFLLGVLVQSLLVKPLLSGSSGNPHARSALVLFGAALLIETLLTILFTADIVGIHTAHTNAVVTLGNLRLPLAKIVAMGLALVSLAVLFAAFNFTLLGKAISATYSNRDAAQLLGIDVERIDQLTYGLATVFAGVAGLVIATSFSFSPASIMSWIVIGLAVAVIGGKGSTLGTLVAGLLVGILEAATAYTISANWLYLAVYTLLLFVIAVRPTGLLGERL